MNLRNKNILLLSPQAWGKMFISKHHYAIELAKRGNSVYYLNPPNEGASPNSDFSFTEFNSIPGLTLVQHNLKFPYSLKFHWNWLYHLLMKHHIKKLLATLPVPIDIVWSFDLNYMYDLRSFPERTFKIFHPVDEPQNNDAIRSARGAQLIFSVTEEIIAKYSFLKVPAFSINHGVSAQFIESGSKTHINKSGVIKVGLSGNFLRQDIDRPILLQIINDHPQVQFHCWGACDVKGSNLGGSQDAQTATFLERLHKSLNVVMHGAVSADDLANKLPEMDMFLICYDVLKDQSKGTNYHKVLEYLSTGKVIVSNNITTYRNDPHLVIMVQGRENNHDLPDLFTDVLSKLSDLNSPERQAERKAFAAINTYSAKLDIIEGKLL